MLWLSRELRMAFSYEAVQDGSIRWLERAVSEQIPATEFVFHFSEVPEDPRVCREILEEVGLRDLTPRIRSEAIAASA